MPVPYVVVSAADLALTAFGSGRARRLRWLTKPLLMPTLAWWMRTHRRHSYGTMMRRTQAALGLSAVGDVALLRDDDAGFLRGLGAFLAAHVAYVSAFSARRRPWGSPGTARRVAPVVAVWATAVPALAARAGRLRVPVALYGTAIALMQVTALMLDDRMPARGRTRVALGAACFMLSDALIGARRFLLPARYGRAADVGVMATYVTAQWLIADGVVRASERGR
ncbi:MAG TPA: lysoplasmalogenase [Nocardioidaceae bacterium]|nr:lysoplasmalogenase [Nocardioidaceae bacterium]